MLNIRILQGIFLCLFLISNADFVISSEFVPWKKGDSATFVDSLSNTTKVEIDEQIASWRHFTDFAGLGPLWIRTTPENERVYFWNSEKKRKQLFIDFDNPEGTTIDIDISPCNSGIVQIEDKEDQITVPAGTFDSVIRLDFETSCADGGVTTAWFAPEVGVVKWKSSNIAGIVTNEMIQGAIGEANFPQGLTVNATFPDPVVTIDLEPPVDPNKPPTTVNVFLTIENNTGGDLKYVFNSGQQFEIMLLDADENVVSRWSRGRAFTLAIQILTFKRGNKLSFGGPIELSDHDGKVLPGGNYTLRIEMTSAPNPESDHQPGSERIGATAPFTIQLAL